MISVREMAVTVIKEGKTIPHWMWFVIGEDDLPNAGFRSREAALVFAEGCE